MATVTLAFLFVFGSEAQESGTAAPTVRTSARSGAWEDPNTWTPPGVPATTTAVRIAARHHVCVHGFKRAKSLTIESDGHLVTSTTAPDLEIWCTGRIINRGEVRGGSSWAGGHVVFRAGSFENYGLLKAGDGAQDGFGGLVRIETEHHFLNGTRGRICGGYGGTLDCEVTGGDGGAVDINVHGPGENRGHIGGGRGADGVGSVHGRGGFVRVHSTAAFLNCGRIRGGVGPSNAPDGEVFVTGSSVRLAGHGWITGGTVVVQAERQSIALDTAHRPALEATAGPVRLIAAGPITGASAAGAAIATTPSAIEVIAKLDGPTVALSGADGATTHTRRRATIDSAHLARHDGHTRIEATLHAPDDAGCRFVASFSTSQLNGTLLAPFGQIEIDHATVDCDTAPANSIRGTLDPRGRASFKLDVPPESVGAELYVAAVILAPTDGTIVNVTPATRLGTRHLDAARAEVAIAQPTRAKTAKLSAKNPK